MRRIFGFTLICMALLSLLACGKQRTLPSLATIERDGYVAIVWEDRTYIPFCVVSKSDCGKKIGCVNGDMADIVSEYQDLPPEEWIANYLTMDGGAILFREEHVNHIPDGLESEYEWNP